MVEAASNLDIDRLAEKKTRVTLIPNKYTIPLHKRRLDLFFLIFIFISELAYFYRWIQEGSSVIIIIILAIALAIWWRSKIDRYTITDRGLLIPYTWFSRKIIAWNHIVNIAEFDFHENKTPYMGINLELDTPLIRFNTTGLKSPNILFTSKDYHRDDLMLFFEDIQRYRQKLVHAPNTLAQRLTDQVERSWQNRFKLVLLNLIDSSSEALLLLLILGGLTYGVSGFEFWVWIGIILFGTYLLIIFLLQMLDKPSAIIGIRPHELGPILYDDADILTTLRFILICYPYSVKILNCKLIFSNENITQLGQLKQIYPEIVEPGTLKHVVAQIYGNHSQAIGAEIQFTYAEREGEEIIYEVSIYWS
jgi:hypothetical protein